MSYFYFEGGAAALPVACSLIFASVTPPNESTPVPVHVQGSQCVNRFVLQRDPVRRS